FCLFYSTPRTPPPTVFPYTTLFRSKHVGSAAKGCPSLLLKRVSPHVLRHTCALTILQATKDLRKVSLWLGHSNMQTTEMYTRAEDRKSTRLNSSHVKISYAVFCLKK